MLITDDMWFSECHIDMASHAYTYLDNYDVPTISIGETDSD